MLLSLNLSLMWLKRAVKFRWLARCFLCCCWQEDCFTSLRKANVPKKVLIITYYWPPAGGPGVQRWLKFVKYLPQFNVEPIVYIPENPNYPLVDDSLRLEVPKG